MVVMIVIRLTTHLWTLTPLWCAKQIPSRRCRGSYTNEKGLCSLFTRHVPVETTSHNPPLEILTVSASHLLDGICLARQSGLKVQRWVVSRMTIVTTILQNAVLTIIITTVPMEESCKVYPSPAVFPTWTQWLDWLDLDSNYSNYVLKGSQLCIYDCCLNFTHIPHFSLNAVPHHCNSLPYLPFTTTA